MFFPKNTLLLFLASSTLLAAAGPCEDAGCDQCLFHSMCFAGPCPASVLDCSSSTPGGPTEQEQCSNTAGAGGKDMGCTAPNKICVHANGAIVKGNGADGDHCARCINSKRGGGGKDVQDFGCGANRPVCVGKPGADLSAMVEGLKCARCFNSLESVDACDLDDGCPPSKPDCALQDGSSPPIWHPGDKCVANCKNTKEEDGTDYGCHGEYPFCVRWNRTEPQKNKSGKFCSTCSEEFCDDNDQCTIDSCDIDNGCSNVPNKDCDDGIGCTVDSCDPATGLCVNTPDDGACPSGQSCVASEGCVSVDIDPECNGRIPDEGFVCKSGQCDGQGRGGGFCGQTVDGNGGVCYDGGECGDCSGDSDCPSDRPICVEIPDETVCPFERACVRRCGSRRRLDETSFLDEVPTYGIYRRGHA